MEHATPAVIIFIILLIAPVLTSIYYAHKGKQFFIRRIPGIDAMDEAIERSVELGRPISFTSGPLLSIGPLLYACLHSLRYIAERAAVFSAKLFVPCADPEVLILSDATVQNAYRSQNRYSLYDPSTIRFLSTEQFAYASGYMGLIHREQVGSCFLFGSFAAESLILSESGQQVGAVQVAATTSNEQIPFFITTCDYTLIGEELYAAGAYLSADPVQTGSLRGQDIGKLLILCLIIVGVILATYVSLSKGDETLLSNIINASWDDLLVK